jgi:hypothetical protein
MYPIWKSRFFLFISTNRKKFALAFYLLLTTIIIFAGFSHWGYDDPYITYRYSANIQHGLGFVYNPGERVLSTTTPLFTLLLALLGNLCPDLPTLANLLGAFSLAIGGFFLFDLAHTWRTPLVGWSGLLLYPTFPLLVSTLGSETLLYLAFCMGAFAFYARQRYPLTGVCVALAILTRPDGVLVAFILAAHYFMRIRRPVPWLALGLFFGLTIPWFVFAWIYFGSPLPVTLVVKQHQGSMVISQGFASGLLTIIGWYTSWPYLLEAGLAAVGAIFLLRTVRSWVLFLCWTMLYFLAYSGLGVSRNFWYYAPLVPGFIVLLGLGISNIGKKLSSSRSNLFQNIIIVALILLLVSTQGENLWLLRQRPDNRLVIYKVVGEWLRDHTPTTASIGTLEVGIIGFYAQRRMIDFAGLIQPEVSDQLTNNTTFEDAALWAFEKYHPDYLVLGEGDFPRFEKDYVYQQCKAIQHFPGQVYGYSTNLNVYACEF